MANPMFVENQKIVAGEGACAPQVAQNRERPLVPLG